MLSKEEREMLKEIAKAMELALANKMIGIIEVVGPGGRFTIPASYVNMLDDLLERTKTTLNGDT